MGKTHKKVLYTIIRLYRNLISQKRISHNGAAFRRMIQLEDKLKELMPYPMARNEVGSETGIEQEELPLPADNFKSEFDWLASFKSIFKNLVDIIRLLIKWR